jgi:hypothetical protein
VGLLFLALVLSLSVHAAEPPVAELKTTAVAVFKSGMAFIVRQGDVTLDGGSGRIAPIPSPTLGTLWIAPNDAGASLDEVVAYRYKVPGKHTLDSLAAVLSANAGKSVTVVYDQKEITGEIVGLRETEMPPDDPQPVPFLWRIESRPERQLQTAAKRDPWNYRSQWRRQNHAVQPHHRRDRAR